MFSSDIETILSEVEENNKNGAAELAAKATEVLTSLDISGKSKEAVLEEICRLGSRLIHAQPKMAPIVSLVNGLLLQASEAHADGLPDNYINQYCRRFLDNLRADEEKLYCKAAGVLRDHDTVLTHSASSSVRETLLAAHKAGKHPQVICTESRPVCEGIEQARTFAQNEIPVRLIVDSASAYYLPDTDIVLLGADAIGEDSFVNKIGTRMLALAAQAAKVDLYILCTSHKFLPPGLELPSQKENNPREIMTDPPNGIVPANIYFEKTPLRHCAAIITENGLHKTSKLKQKLHRLKIDPALQEALKGKGNENE